MPSKRDPTSVKGVALDVATSVTLVIGAIAIAWLKQFAPQQQPSITAWILLVSEVTLLFYFATEWVKACRFLFREIRGLLKEIKPQVEQSQAILKRMWSSFPSSGSIPIFVGLSS